MTQLCKQCRRPNPREATYCYFDGALLDGHAGGGGAVDVSTWPFPLPLMLPSGRALQNFNQLAVACCEQRDEVLGLLRQGPLESFLAAIGRSDLARAARAAAAAADPQRGLDDLLDRLPGAVLAPPRLRVEPVKIELGILRPGSDRRCEFVLHNDGQRLLSGSARCDAPWLSLGDGPGVPSKVFQFGGRSVLAVQIVGRHLRAYGKPQEARIVLESNGGSAEVVVRVVVPVKPFPEGVVCGALSPRQVAHKARDAAKEAAVLIENGELARWYESNGWTYPVRGPAASGVAAVQQFLEALGLVKPPRVELSEESIQLRGRVGEKLEYSLSVVTQENRAAIAHGSSDQPWLQVGPTIYRGRCAFLPLTIAAIPSCPGETLRAEVKLTANGEQRFVVPVSLAVAPLSTITPEPAPVPAPGILVPARTPKRRAPPPKPASAPAAASPFEAFAPQAPVSHPRPEPAAGSGGGSWLVRGLLLLVCAVALGTLGVVGWRLSRPTGDKEKGPTPPPPDPGPILAVTFQEDPQDKAIGAATMTFGLALPRLHERLTFDERGRSNNVCYRLDGKEFLLGYEGGTWETLLQVQGSGGWRSVWLHQSVAFTQTVEIVPGPQSDQSDTCLIRYTLENRDTKVHKVGLRFLLDTFIGSRDGVPFAVPGLAQLCDTSCDRQGADVPDFIEALEKDDLAEPGVIARLGLRGDTGLEAPGRVIVGGWPDAKLQATDKRAQGNLTRWDVPLLSLKAQADSAVTLYWPEADLAPGARREIGFSYGLGSLTVDGKGRLALSVGGAFTPGGELTLAAYVKNPAKDETLTLEGPAGWALVAGQPTAAVAAPAAAASRPITLVTWRVKTAASATSGRLRVRSSTGISQEIKVTLRAGR